MWKIWLIPDLTRFTEQKRKLSNLINTKRHCSHKTTKSVNLTDKTYLQRIAVD